MPPIENIQSPDVFGNVVNAATGLRDAPDYTKSRAVLHVVSGRIDNAADALDTSTYKFASLPSTCILNALTTFDLQNWGYAAVTAGDASDEDSLMASVTVGTEADVRKPIAHADARWNEPLWQALGMSEDPGGRIDLYFHTAANATGAGYITFEVFYQAN